MTIVQAASKLRPGTAWNWDGETLTQAVDGTPRVAVPTMEELQPIIDSDSYIAKRIASYPPISDQLDALWKGGQAQIDMQAQVMAIKAKYPKPG